MYSTEFHPFLPGNSTNSKIVAVFTLYSSFNTMKKELVVPVIHLIIVTILL